MFANFCLIRIAAAVAAGGWGAFSTLLSIIKVYKFKIDLIDLKVGLLLNLFVEIRAIWRVSYLLPYLCYQNRNPLRKFTNTMVMIKFSWEFGVRLWWKNSFDHSRQQKFRVYFFQNIEFWFIIWYPQLSKNGLNILFLRQNLLRCVVGCV